MTIIAIDTSARLTAMARKEAWPSKKKNRMKGVLANIVTSKAAGRKCMRQKTQPITVMAMQNTI